MSLMARGAFAILLVSLLLASSRVVSASSSTATPIQHLIIIMQENHTFDNYFGTYPTANNTLLDSTTDQLQPVDGIPNQICLPYEGSCVSPHLTTTQYPSNPVEGQQTYEMDYSHGGTGFATYSGPQSMAYFDYHSIAGYWDYAEEYGLGDNYYAPVLSTTTPNRLMLLAGNTPVSANYGPPPYVLYSQTVMHQLDDATVSWGYYEFLGAQGRSFNLYPLNYTSDIPQQALGRIRSISDLDQELANGSGLPSVSFVNPLGRLGLSEHPPFNPTLGEIWVMSIVNQVMESSYWPTTAIFVTWDEGGGYYDHVIPPREFTVNHDFTQVLLGLGQRVPLLVISPYSRENFVSNLLLSHLSLLHFIEYNWNLAPLGELVSLSNLPLDFFDFSQAPRLPIILSSTVTYPIPLQSQSSVTLPGPGLQYGFLLASMVLLLLLFGLRMKRSSLQPSDKESQQKLQQPPQSLARRG